VSYHKKSFKAIPTHPPAAKFYVGHNIMNHRGKAKGCIFFANVGLSYNIKGFYNFEG